MQFATCFDIKTVLYYQTAAANTMVGSSFDHFFYVQYIQRGDPSYRRTKPAPSASTLESPKVIESFMN